MSSNEILIRLPELGKLDARELTEELSKTVQFQEEALTTDKAGEPVTLVAIVALSALAIKGISMWLLKIGNKGEAEFTFELGRADGSFEKRTARVVFDSSSPPPASVIEQVGAALGA